MNPSMRLFPFAEYWPFYLGFLLLVFVLLALDLGVFHRKAHAVSIREAAGWSVVWVTLALLFNLAFFAYMRWHFPQDARLMALPGFDPLLAARETALEFLAGYVVEYSLSIDNIFVFVVVLTYFGVPAAYPAPGAVLRHPRGPRLPRDLHRPRRGAPAVRVGGLALRRLPGLHGRQDDGAATGDRSSRTSAGSSVSSGSASRSRRTTTATASSCGTTAASTRPRSSSASLFLEMTDILFAVDSVPAIFGLTREPFVVFTSNIFAILGLRNLYFLLAGAVDKFHFLKYGLGIVLVFVGLKMTVLNRLWHGHFPITWSLGIIVGVIAVSIALSLLFPKQAQEGS